MDMNQLIKYKDTPNEHKYLKHIERRFSSRLDMLTLPQLSNLACAFVFKPEFQDIYNRITIKINEHINRHIHLTTLQQWTQAPIGYNPEEEDIKKNE